MKDKGVVEAGRMLAVQRCQCASTATDGKMERWIDSVRIVSRDASLKNVTSEALRGRWLYM